MVARSKQSAKTSALLRWIALPFHQRGLTGKLHPIQADQRTQDCVDLQPLFDTKIPRIELPHHPMPEGECISFGNSEFVAELL